MSTTTGQYSSSYSSSKHQPNFLVRWFSKLMAFDFRFGQASYSRMLENRFVREETKKLLQEIMSTKKSSGTSCNCKYQNMWIIYQSNFKILIIPALHNTPPNPDEIYMAGLWMRSWVEISYKKIAFWTSSTPFFMKLFSLNWMKY